MDFTVTKENSEAFEKVFHSIYVPAMTVQKGYLWSKLLRLFPAEISKSIEAEPTEYNYQVQIAFDTEETGAAGWQATNIKLPGLPHQNLQRHISGEATILWVKTISDNTVRVNHSRFLANKKG